MDRAETAEQASSKQTFGGRGGEHLCLFVSPLLQRFTHVRFMLTSELEVPILSQQSTNSAARHIWKIFQVYFQSEISRLNWVGDRFYSGTENMFLLLWVTEKCFTFVFILESHLLSSFFALERSCLPLSGCSQPGGQQVALLSQSCDVTSCSRCDVTSCRLLQLVPGGGERSCCVADRNRTEFYFNISE